MFTKKYFLLISQLMSYVKQPARHEVSSDKHKIQTQHLHTSRSAKLTTHTRINFAKCPPSYVDEASRRPQSIQNKTMSNEKY